MQCIANSHRVWKRQLTSLGCRRAVRLTPQGCGRDMRPTPLGCERDMRLERRYLKYQALKRKYHKLICVNKLHNNHSIYTICIHCIVPIKHPIIFHERNQREILAIGLKESHIFKISFWSTKVFSPSFFWFITDEHQHSSTADEWRFPVLQQPLQPNKHFIKWSVEDVPTFFWKCNTGVGRVFYKNNTAALSQSTSYYL